jgi:membrane protease subunit (stomatin/prohibitin family)
MPWKVIEYQDPTGEIMVARVPEQGTAELVSGSQLIVQDGQIAAFFHDGKPTDGFRAGRYTLSTENLPVLSKLLNLATLSRSPFRSYVYFIALKTFTDLGWGTSSPILFRDTEFRMVNLRAHGAFSIRIGDLKVFLRTMIGTQGMETTFAIEEYLRKIIVCRLTQVLPEAMTTVLDLPRSYTEIAAKTKAAVREEFEQYGLELVDLLVEAITLPQEVQDAINRAAGSRAVGKDELDQYERTARADAVRDSAKLPGGGLAAGMAAGMQMGAQLGGADLPEFVPDEPAGPTANQIRAKLKELKQLMDEGLITQADFEAQKKRLLDQV